MPPEMEPPILPTEGPSATDLAAKNRAVDVSQTVTAQVQSTEQLLATMISRMESLTTTVAGIPAAFASTADHIKRSTDATEKLAKASKKVADEQERGSKATKNTRFSVKDTLQALARGDIQGAISEGFQGLPGQGIFTRRKEEANVDSPLGQGSLFDKLTGRGRLPGPATEEGEVVRAGGGLLRNLKGGSKLAALGLGESLFTPAALYGAYKLFNDVNNQRQTGMRTMDLTGEDGGRGISSGFGLFPGAGVTGVNIPILGRMGGEAGALRGSPFDLISSRDAMEIVQGVRGQGFRGGDARNTEEAIAGMINDLGIGVQDAMNIAIPAIKDAGMSTGELSAQMSTLDDTAKASRVGINELTTAVGQMITSLAGQSRLVARGSAPAVQSLMGAFQGTLAGRHVQDFTAIYGGDANRKALAQLSGFAPFQAYSPQFNRQFEADFQRQLVMIAKGNYDSQGRQRIDWNSYVQQMLLNPLYQQMFSGVPVDDVADMLRTAWKGSKHGTNTAGWINKRNTERTESSTKGIAQGFEHTMKSKTGGLQDPFGITHHITDLFGNKSNGVNRDLVRKTGMEAEQQVAKQLMTLGLTKAERREILDPITKAAKSGDRGATEKALNNVDNQIKQLQKEGKVHVQLSMTPRFERYVTSTSASTIASLRGLSGTQGTNIHP